MRRTCNYRSNGKKRWTAGAAADIDTSPARGIESAGGRRGLSDDIRCRRVGARDVWGGIHLLGDVVLVRTTADRTKRFPLPGRASRPRTAGGGKKGDSQPPSRRNRILWSGLSRDTSSRRRVSLSRPRSEEARCRSRLGRFCCSSGANPTIDVLVLDFRNSSNASSKHVFTMSNWYYEAARQALQHVPPP